MGKGADGCGYIYGTDTFLKEVLERFKKERLKVEEKDFLSFEPQTTGYAIKIPKEKIIKNK